MIDTKSLVLLLAAALAAILAVLASCGGNRGGTLDVQLPQRNELVDGSMMPVLGNPAGLLRNVSYVPEDRAQDAGNIETGLPKHNVASTGIDAIFSPSWDQAGNAGAADLAFAVYAFSLEGYSEAPQISLGWNSPVDASNVYLGVGDQKRHSWSWFTSNTDNFILLSMANFLDNNGRLVIAVVLAGTEEKELDWVRIGENILPVADLDADQTSGDMPLTVTFDSTGSYDVDGGIGLVHWDFDGDGISEDTTMGPGIKQFEYTSAGTFDAKVRVGDGDGGEDAAVVQIIVNDPLNEPPIADLTASPLSGGPGTIVSFDASASFDPDGTIKKVEWDWEGDGEYDFDSGTLLSAQHTYGEQGDYIATVRVFDNINVSDTDSVTITISDDTPNTPPVAAIEASPTIMDTGTTVNFTAAASSDSDGTIVKYEWDWEGNETYDYDSGASPVASHLYTAAGTFHPTVRVTDDDGATSNAPVTIVVRNPGEYHETENNDDISEADELPTPDFDEVFRANLGVGGYDGDEDDWYSIYMLTGYKYTIEMLDFLNDDADLDMRLFESDGTTEVGYSTSVGDSEEIKYTPPADGLYYLRCYVYNSSGTSDYSLNMTHVEAVLPVAVIEATPVSGTRVLVVNFEGGSSYSDAGDIVKYEWDFNGDGYYDVSKTLSDPPVPEDSQATAYYFGKGMYNAALRVTDSEDSSATAQQEITVTGGPDGETEPNNDNDTGNTQDDADAANLFPAFDFANLYGNVGPKAEAEGDPGDPDDWFKFTLTIAGEVDLYMELFDAICDIDMALYADGDYSTSLETSVDTDDDEQITINLNPGTYYLRVYAFSSRPQAGGYRLSGTYTL